MRSTPHQPIHTTHVVAREPAADVGRLYVAFVNVYFAGARGGRWALVDTGLPHFAALVRNRASERYGPQSRPEAVILTHGHFDHAGNALELARAWDAPIYAHRLELPYLTGLSEYPPQDPTVGGTLGLMSRAFPRRGINLADRIQALPEDGSVPGMPEWRWEHTPGHTPGHVSLFRERDRFLIAGDAFATVDQDSPLAMFNLRAEFSVPPAPLTTDWAAALESVQKLAALRPETIAAGHGRPVHGDQVADDLVAFADRFTPPRRGRYVSRPAIADERGVIEVPPPVDDPLPRKLLVGGLIASGAYLAFRARRRDNTQG